MLPKRKFREIVFQILFSSNFAEIEDAYISSIMEIVKTTKKNIKEAQNYALKVTEKIKYIDEMIKKTSKDYRLERISKVELNILRLGLFEIFFEENVPKKVAISEAVRVCRKFGTRDSAKFVNAILDNLYKNFDFKKYNFEK